MPLRDLHKGISLAWSYYLLRRTHYRLIRATARFTIRHDRRVSESDDRATAAVTITMTTKMMTMMMRMIQVNGMSNDMDGVAILNIGQLITKCALVILNRSL